MSSKPRQRDRQRVLGVGVARALSGKGIEIFEGFFQAFSAAEHDAELVAGIGVRGIGFDQRAQLTLGFDEASAAAVGDRGGEDVRR